MSLMSKRQKMLDAATAPASALPGEAMEQRVRLVVIGLWVISKITKIYKDKNTEAKIQKTKPTHLKIPNPKS